VFYAYFTTKPSGTGLGLSGAQKILLAHGGNISFRTEVGKGTTFTVVVPAASDKPRLANA
jgi:signal transduction histidine kinase